MDSDCILAVIYVGKQVWDRFIIQYDSVSVILNKNEETSEEEKFSCGDMLKPKSLDLSRLINGQDSNKQISTYRITVTMSGHELSYFVKLLKVLDLYRKLVIQYLKSRKLCSKSPDSSLIILRIHLIDVNQQIIDKIWNDYITYSIAEQCELDHAMSWLSTLGGAFSALGDYYTRCAETAGQISLQQFRLALRIGDPNTVARCLLFSALSLMQTGHLRTARQIIWKQYHDAKSGSNGLAPDTRLIRMCLGCWAKLRYEYQQRRYRRQNPKALHWKNK